MAVQPQFLAGLLSAFTMSYVGIGTSFCLQNRIVHERPKFIFGVHSLALGVCAASVAVGRLHVASDSYSLWTVAIGAELVALALMLHFVLVLSLPAPPARLPLTIYSVTLVLEIANLWRGLARPVSADGGFTSGWTLGHAGVRISLLGGLAWLLGSAVLLVSIPLLARAGRRETTGPLVGAVIATISWIRDGLIAVGIVDGRWVGPLGSAIFVVSVADSYLFRHARLSRDLERDYVQLRDAQRELQRKEHLTAIGELAAVVAHEIRNPLAIIANSVAGLRRRDLPKAEIATLLGILGEESTRLNGLVSNLLAYAKPIVPKPQRVTVREILQRTIMSIGQKGALEIEIFEQADQVYADPHLLRHVLDNLVDNAGHAMNWQGTVRIAVQSAKRGYTRGVIISVEDRGEGMGPEVSARARNPFFTTRATGTGLGLAIVDRIVEAHGGELTIESKSGVGTTVSAFIPDRGFVPTGSVTLNAADRARLGIGPL
jgi:signal transduction histidine kinase